MSSRSKKSVKSKNNLNTKRAISSALLLAAGLLFTPIHSAHAYVDPGTGSYILQITIGVIFGIAFAVKSFWSSIISTLRGNKKSPKDTSGKKESKEKSE